MKERPGISASTEIKGAAVPEARFAAEFDALGGEGYGTASKIASLQMRRTPLPFEGNHPGVQLRCRHAFEAAASRDLLPLVPFRGGRARWGLEWP